MYREDPHPVSGQPVLRQLRLELAEVCPRGQDVPVEVGVAEHVVIEQRQRGADIGGREDRQVCLGDRACADDVVRGQLRRVSRAVGAGEFSEAVGAG